MKSRTKYTIILRVLMTVLTDILFSLVSIVLGYLVADFLTGVYHWIKDTYFSPFTPIIGPKLIWGSRLHHVRPRHIIDHSDLELFLGSAQWTSFWIIPLAAWIGPSLFLVSLFLTISLNDVVHKYSHVTEEETPELVKHLQKLHIIQGYDEHHQHHVYPHTVNYCPITPYVNTVLEKLNLWRRLEDFIEKHFGVKPRDNVDKYVEDCGYPGGVRFIPDDDDNEKTENIVVYDKKTAQ